MPLTREQIERYKAALENARTISADYCDTPYDKNLINKQISIIDTVMTATSSPSFSDSRLTTVVQNIENKIAELNKICAELRTTPRSPTRRIRYPMQFSQQDFASTAYLHRHPNGQFSIEVLPVNPGEIPALTPQDNPMFPDGNFNYVIKVSDPLHIRVGHAGHSGLAHGERVFYAGFIVFNQGKLVYWNNDSGHYQPASEQAQKALQNMLPIDQFRCFDIK